MRKRRTNEAGRSEDSVFLLNNEQDAAAEVVEMEHGRLSFPDGQSKPVETVRLRRAVTLVKTGLYQIQIRYRCPTSYCKFFCNFSLIITTSI